MRAFAHDVFTYPLPPGHRFPLGKYRLVREGAERIDGLVVQTARSATSDELAQGHAPAYIAQIESGELSRRELLSLGLPWSPELVERARRSVGATILAADAAIEDGRAANLGGGTHHAFYDSGRGFCVFNDVVCARRGLQARGLARRVLVVDLDVHQGDGTHAAFRDDPDAFTLSVNGFANYPFQRVPGDLDVDLPDGTGDERYLEVVAQVVPKAMARARPDLCFYLAGADPYAGDRLGRLAVSRAGLEERDRIVLGTLARAGIPVCLTLAGGYAEPIEDTVEINLATLRVLCDAA